MSIIIENTEKLFSDILSTLEKKGKDYTNPNVNPFSNFEASHIIGVTPERSILIRVLDKIGRMNQLLDKNPSVKNEPLEDSIKDIIGYMAILHAYRSTNTKATTNENSDNID